MSRAGEDHGDPQLVAGGDCFKVAFRATGLQNCAHADARGEAHDIIERVEADLREAFPGTELLIHIDPEGHVDEPGNVLVESDQFRRLDDPR